MSLREHLGQFDFLGLILIVGGVVCVLIGFNSGETNWSSAETIALLTVGCILLIAAGINEVYTSRSPIIPPRLFKTRTTAIILVSNLLHAMTFFAGAYYLPLYFQVLGSSATGAGVKMLPFSLGGAAFSAIAGILISRIGAYRPIIWFAWGAMLLGWGLMTQLDDTSSTPEKVLYPLVTAMGVGCLFQTPLIALQAAMPLKDMATSTATFGFLRTMGGTVGISTGQAIYSSILKKKLAKIPNLDFDTSPAALSESVRQLKNIADPTQRQEVIHAYTQSISTIWIVNAPLIGIGLIMVIFLKAYTLKRNTVRSGAQRDVEAGPAPAANGIDEKQEIQERGATEERERTLREGVEDDDDVKIPETVEGDSEKGDTRTQSETV